MTLDSSLTHISAMSLFVEDLTAAKTFYKTVFGVKAIFEDANSAALRFDNLIVNLLQADSAPEIIEPGVGRSRRRSRRSMHPRSERRRRMLIDSGTLHTDPNRRLLKGGGQKRRNSILRAARQPERRDPLPRRRSSADSIAWRISE
jgi:catechol 2,3-dioxygenase-like lactoylglutathione lyase family enzyme